MKKIYAKKFTVFVLAFFALSLVRAQQTYTFTNCGATGLSGPTAAHVNTTYASTNLSGSVSVSGGVQSFTIPLAGNYKIEAWGAAGGTQLYAPGFPGGKGAYMSGNFTFTAGTVLNIIVGQKGNDTQGVPVDNAAPGGGGGSFVYINASDPTPLIAAGGGGGGGRFPGSLDANITTNGNAAFSGAPGGTPGNGGGVNAGIGSSYWAGSGSGWLTDGTGGNQATIYNYLPGSTGAQGGRRPANGALGGVRYNDGTDEGGDGGFGGGGGGGSDNMGTGGGGGYSGGGGGNGTNNNTGGGGGSYNSGLNQVNTASVNIGHGKVQIVELCNISLTTSAPNSTAPSICSGQSVTLTTNAVSNYSWSNGNTTSNTIVVSPTVTTVYTLSAMSVSNCIATNSVLVIVSGGQPTLSVVSSTNQTCLGKTATLTASGAVTYTWTNGVTNGVSFFPTTTTTYTVTGQNGCGITTAVTTITVSPLAVTAVSSASAICTNKTATLSVTAAATSYTWNPGNITGTSPNLIVNPQTNTDYTITVSDGTCSGVGNVSVVANPVPTITAVSTVTSVCPGGTVGLSATGGINYTWTPVNLNGASITATPQASTLFNVTGDNSFGCLNNASQVVVVGAQPTLVLSCPSPSICGGSSATLTASGADTYAWLGGPTTTTYVVSPSGSTTYSATGTNTTSGCSDTKTFDIGVFTPTLTVSGASVVCEGGQVNITASGANTYTWNPGGLQFAAITVNPPVTTTYTVDGMASQGALNCPGSTTFQLVVNPNPTVTATSVKPAICAKETNTYTASGATSYTWTGNAGSVVGPSITVTSSISTILVYTLTGTNAQGCLDDQSITASIFACTGLEQSVRDSNRLTIYPNPNNGEFTIEAASEAELTLVNELGQVVKEIRLTENNDRKVTLSQLSNGLYFLTGEGVKQKILVNK